MFIPRAEELWNDATLLKSLAILPCAAWARRWKASSVGKKTHAFPCATLTFAENISCSHQSCHIVSVPPSIVRSPSVTQYRSIAGVDASCAVGPTGLNLFDNLLGSGFICAAAVEQPRQRSND